jgi:hypothetical protein
MPGSLDEALFFVSSFQPLSAPLEHHGLFSIRVHEGKRSNEISDMIIIKVATHPELTSADLGTRHC